MTTKPNLLDNQSKEEPKYLFRQTHFEAFIKAFNLDKNSEALAEIKAATGYDHFRPKREYPVEVAFMVVDYIAKRFYSHLTTKEALVEISEQEAKSYLQNTIMGRVSFASGQQLSPLKLLQTFCNDLNEMNNYKDRSVVVTGPNSACFKMPHDPIWPVYNATGIKTILELNGVKNVKVNYRIISKDNVEFDVSWQY